MHGRPHCLHSRPSRNMFLHTTPYSEALGPESPPGLSGVRQPEPGRISPPPSTHTGERLFDLSDRGNSVTATSELVGEVPRSCRPTPLHALDLKGSQGLCVSRRKLVPSPGCCIALELEDGISVAKVPCSLYDGGWMELGRPDRFPCVARSGRFHGR